MIYNTALSDNTALSERGDQRDDTRHHPRETSPDPSLFDEIFEAPAIGLGLLAPDGRWLRTNRRLSQRLGYAEAELKGKPFTQILHPDETPPELFYKATGPQDAGQDRSAELRCQPKDGAWFWGHATITPIKPPNGGRDYFVCSLQDIHGLKSAQESLVLERRLMVQQLRMQAAVFNATQEGMLIITPDDIAIACNPAFTEITDYTNEDIRGKHVKFLFSSQSEGSGWDAIKATLLETGNWAGESWNRRKTGEVYLDWMTIHSLTDDQGRLINYVLTSIDITRMPHAQTELERLAFNDPLTGLPNRTLLMNRITHAISRARRNSILGAVLFIDLDGFKAINDQYGHAAGDELLKQVAQRLKTRLREVDTVARVGGDEFVAVVEDIKGTDNIGTVAKALLAAMAKSFTVAGNVQIRISGSIGVTLFGANSPDAATLIARADKALYAAKKAGRGCYRLDRETLTVGQVTRALG
jgi:diguanylate cyclase (GGDEF)-like protein/PAS domain S-box-containing protein